MEAASTQNEAVVCALEMLLESLIVLFCFVGVLWNTLLLWCVGMKSVVVVVLLSFGLISLSSLLLLKTARAASFHVGIDLGCYCGCFEIDGRDSKKRSLVSWSSAFLLVLFLESGGE